jgi:hypothetical protein
VAVGNGVVLQAVVEVMTLREGPMAASEVHGALERRLRHRVSRDSVYGCLSTGTQGDMPRFRRIAPGRYVIVGLARS